MVNTTWQPENVTENKTDVSTEQQSLSSAEIFCLCIYLILFILGVVGNGLVIFVTGYKMKTTVNSIWFLNLAIADLIFIFNMVHMIFVIIHRSEWSSSDTMCKCTTFVYVLNMFASVFFLTVISLDRCLCTWVTVWAQNKRTPAKARIICVFVWLLSISCSLPFLMNRVLLVVDRAKICVYSSIDAINSLVIFSFIIGFVIPFLVIASSYIAIVVRVKRLKRQKSKSFRIIMAVILAFFICWFPFHVQHLCLISVINNNLIDRFFNIFAAAIPYIYFLAYLNSCLNPILYVFMCDEFKKKLKTSLLLVFETAFTEE